jgi:hypothetical protein
VGKPESNRPFGNLSINGKIILEYIKNHQRKAVDWAEVGG